jgi:glycerol-3-phosphate acyltransferase PlsX
MTIKISIDCMGGDHGPSVTVPAAISFAKHHPDAELILVGREDAVRAELRKCKAEGNPHRKISE